MSDGSIRPLTIQKTYQNPSDGPPVILVVEDDAGDSDLALEALEECSLDHDPYVVRDGAEALEFLRSEGLFEGTPHPDLILLDLDMPRMCGREFLKQVKADPVMKQIPVVVFSTSQSDEDVRESYRLQAAAYVTKPVQFSGFVQAVSAIANFWLAAVTYPNEDRASRGSGLPSGSHLDKEG